MLAHPPGACKHRHCPRNAVGRSTCRVNRHGEAIQIRALQHSLCGRFECSWQAKGEARKRRRQPQAVAGRGG